MTVSRIEPLTEDNLDGAFAPSTSSIHRRLIQTLRTRAPYVVPLVSMEVRAELALWCKLFPNSKA